MGRYAGSLSWALRMLGLGFHEKKKRSRHILSAILVVMLSVVPLIIAIALVNGMTYGITSKYINLSSFHARVHGVSKEDVSGADHVKSVYQAAESFSLIYGPEGSVSTLLKAVDPAYLRSVEFSSQLVDVNGNTEFFSSDDAREITLSRTIASEIGASPGDSIAVVAVGYDEGTSRIRPAAYTVSAIIDSGYKQLDEQLAFIPYAASSRLFSDDPQLSYTGVLFEQQAGQSIETIQASLVSFSDVTTWDQLNSAVYYNFRTSKTILYMIMVFIIFIAAVNISATTILIVQEKHLQIGLLKSIGIPLSTINSSFMLTSALIGLAGSLLGTAVGLILSTQLNALFALLQRLQVTALDFYLVDLPTVIPAGEIAAVITTAVLFAVLTSLIPLKRIRTITPIHLLQE
jgi:lipoprotein-releasing system permease protein